MSALILLFKTFKSIIIVLSVFTLGMAGVLAALWITGNPLSFVAIIGLIALAGIEVKNSILPVDFTNQLRAEGKPLDAAIREAGEIRFLPIVLTTLPATRRLMPIACQQTVDISPCDCVDRRFDQLDHPVKNRHSVRFQVLTSRDCAVCGP